MKKLTKKMKREADVIYYINSEKDIPLESLGFLLAKKMLSVCGWYGYTQNKKKILLIAS